MRHGHTASLFNNLTESFHMIRLNPFARAIALVVSTVFIAGAATSALAETAWEKNHPRRDQVNDRLAKQNRRINKELKEGEITKTQTDKLHKEDRQIRQEERDMASQHGGHITKQEQRFSTNKKTRSASKSGD